MGRPKGAKDAKPRRLRGELTRCRECPPDHPGWTRTEIRSKNKVPYCVEHLPSTNGENPDTSPMCPKCEKSFDFFRWGGSAEETTVHCFCGFSGRALDYYDEIDIKVLASPIEDIQVTTDD